MGFSRSKKQENTDKALDNFNKKLKEFASKKDPKTEKKETDAIQPRAEEKKEQSISTIRGVKKLNEDKPDIVKCPECGSERRENVTKVITFNKCQKCNCTYR